MGQWLGDQPGGHSEQIAREGFTRVVIGEFFLVLAHLPIEFIDEQVDGRVHVFMLALRM